MKRLWRGGLAALVLGLAVGAAGAQQSGGWLPEWLGGKPAPRPEDKALSLPDKARKVPDQSAEHDALMAAWQRRIDVCHRLRQIATETDDAALSVEADRLDDLAERLFKERSGKLLGARSVGLSEGPKVDGVLDETRDNLIQTLEKRRNRAGSGRLSMEGGR